VKQNNRPLIEFLIHRFIHESDPGLRSQLTEILRILMDTSGLDASDGIVNHNGGEASDSDEFLNLFYEKFVGFLVGPVLEIEASNLVRLPGPFG
jgi:protein phosphatase 4 regulatory subunit 3